MDNNVLQSLLIPPTCTIKEAFQRLTDTGLKILFITDPRGKLLGTLSDGDIRRGILAGLSLSSPVETVMKRDFYSLASDAPNLPHVAQSIMQQHMIEQIPITSKEGIITDVLLWVDFLGINPVVPVQPVATVDNPVVIMAGGKGTRLDPFTRILPKPLVPVGERTVLEHIMDRFYRSGFSRFTLIVNYKKEMIKAYFSDRSLPYAVSFVEEEEFYGTAGGLSLLREVLDRTFIVTNCDTVLEGRYSDLLQWHRDSGNIMTIVGSHKEFTVPYGVLHMHQGCLERIEEKPKLDLFINTGTYLFEPSIFAFIDDRQHLDMDQLIRRIQERKANSVGVYPHWGGWFDIGQWDEYRKSLKELSNV